MSKKAFPINRVNIDPPKPVRVAPNPPIALPEREPRNIWVMIGVPALIVALIGTIVMLYVSGVRSLATGFFPLMGIGAFSMLAFSGRFGRARKITWGELEKGRRRYLRDLDTNRDEIQTAVCAQREWQNAVHSDPPGLGAIIGGPRMWERGRGDVDFLEVRVGTGVQHAPDSVLSVTWPDISSDEELEPVTGQALRDFILEQRKIRDIAKVVNLRSAPGFSFVSEDLDRVRSLMRSVLCSLAVFHNPRDVKLMVVTRNPEVWAWMVWLPHNLHDELFDACGWRRLIFATPEELEAALGAELHMKGKRGAWTPPTVASPTAMGSALETGQVGVDLGPHLVIVDDNTGSPDAWESVVGQVGKAGLTELFANHKKWIDLIIHIGQEGRGANVFFMLGGQRLDLSSLQKVKSNIAFRIALRAESGDDSREVIGSDAAYHLPSKENGFALLKVGPRDLEPFRCFYLSAPFVVPKKKEVARTIDMTLTQPRLYDWQYQPLDAADAEALATAAAADAEPDEFLYYDDGFKKKKIVDVLRESLYNVPHRSPRRPWLAPLEDPEPVDRLVAAYRGKPWHVDYGQNPGLMFPVGVMDIPEESQQVVHAVDALRSNIIVVGAKQRGKTTTLMALMCSAATMYTPERVTFFCIGGATMAQIGSLPHVTDIVSPKDAEGIERILSTMDALIDAREEAFRRAKIDMDGFRERRFGIGGDGVGGTDPTDAFGDVFVVLDDYDDLYAKDTLLGDRIISLSSRGPEYGVHLMCSAGGWIHGQRQSLLQNVTARIQLRLADPGESQMGHLSIESREAARRTLNRPGFGLTESLHELRIGVPALADPGTGELVGITDVGARIADVAGVTKHASLQRLPQRVELSAIVEHEAVHQGGDDLSIAFAIGERHELGPVPIKLRESPGLMILGRQGCGKTTALVAIGEAVMNRFSPQQAQLTLIDPKTAPHGLRDLHAPGYVRAYAYDQDEIDEVITELAQQILLPRLPPKGLSQEELRALKPWEGPRHFVLIDDVQDLRPAQSYPQKPPVGAALWKLMERARQVGLHVFSTRNSANWATMPMDPWVKSQTSAKVAQLYMDNDPQNRINRSVRAQTLPPGRGLLVGADGDVEGILVGYPSVPGEQ
ncbi:ESX-2 secretion system protein EccC2 [Mycobacterium tuberculosis M1759]|uniref:type VII secretion protein EccCb n=1 Tax=Mycobacterium tuberculosis TaxID=1773 RepID=UPI0004D6F4F9|nr:type VII secretion protein EccCb [Mycobacterium tuberculosis]KEB66244.1 ESX-2 secretion system protein EccC2 [Mycobacterium tuberculosis M1759]